MITRQIVIDKLLDYLNHRIALAELVDWAETSLIDTAFEPEKDTTLLMDVLTYLGAADTPDFPLTWDVLSEFLDHLGARVQVELAAR
jgi:hypothetical protein